MTKFPLINKRMAYSADCCIWIGKDVVFDVNKNRMQFGSPSSYENTSTLGAKLYCGSEYEYGVYKIGVWSV
jgi:hypothetical protein